MKKTFLIVALILATIILSILLPTISFSKMDAGTCCYQSGSWCIIGSIEKFNYYYKSEGPCP